MFFTLVGLLAGYAIYRESVAPDATLIGSVAPEFELLDQDGQTVRLSDYAGNLVFLNFWATWCGPCIALAPTIDELAEKHDGQLKVCKVDVDANMESAAKFGVRGIPYIILLKDGKKVDEVTGNDPGRVKALAEQALN